MHFERSVSPNLIAHFQHRSAGLPQLNHPLSPVHCVHIIGESLFSVPLSFRRSSDLTAVPFTAWPARSALNGFLSYSARSARSARSLLSDGLQLKLYDQLERIAGRR